MTIPENRAFTRASIDEDDRELIDRARDDAAGGHVDAFVLETRPRQPAEVVAAEAPDVPGAKAESRACRHGRGNLTARQPGEPLDPLLGVRGRMLRDDGQEVDAVLAESDDVEGPRGGRGQLKRKPHGRRSYLIVGGRLAHAATAR